MEDIWSREVGGTHRLSGTSQLWSLSHSFTSLDWKTFARRSVHLPASSGRMAPSLGSFLSIFCYLSRIQSDRAGTLVAIQTAQIAWKTILSGSIFVISKGLFCPFLFEKLEYGSWDCQIVFLFGRSFACYLSWNYNKFAKIIWRTISLVQE